MKYANGAIPWYSSPTNVISEETTLYSDSIPITLMPSSAGDGGMLVWLPNQKILIGAELGRYLPDAGSISSVSIPVSVRLQALDKIKTLQPVTLIPLRGMYISGNANINSAVDAQYDALQSIRDQTLVRINARDTIDEAAAAVALPPDLAASPYNQELVSTVPFIVRNVYHDEMGWFGGETHELAATLTPAAKAAALAGALGGTDALIAAARTAELNARDLAGAEKALYLAEAAYEAAPENATARQVYGQALRKNAFMQKSAQVRNTYLYVALHLEQFVTDFARSGDENATLAFSVADFSAHFSGLSGATLEKVQIVTLPPAESGVLKVDGHDCKPDGDDYDCRPGREIAVADLGKLVFTPAPDWNGETSFTWNGKPAGGNYAVQPATVTITIAPLNDAPAVSSPLSDVTVDEDALSATVDLATVFTDVEGDPLSYTVESSNPALVSATLAGPFLTLDFQAEQSGAATIIVSAADEASGAGVGGLWATDDFVVTVNPVNDAPWANPQTELVTAGLARTFTLDYGDLETAKADLVVTFSGPSVGTLDTSALPSVTYLAPADYIGPDSFAYTITDRGDPDGCTAAPCSGALQAQATVTLDVSENAIKGRVYNDANANGSPDEGEAGVAGVTVRMTAPDGTPIAEQMTGEDGAYAFNSLLPGTYQVRQVLLPGYVQTTPDPADIDLAVGQAVGGVDFGVVYSADLGRDDDGGRQRPHHHLHLRGDEQRTRGGAGSGPDQRAAARRLLHLGHLDTGHVPGRQHGDVRVRHPGCGRERDGNDPGQPDRQEQRDREHGHGDRGHVRHRPAQQLGDGDGRVSPTNKRPARSHPCGWDLAGLFRVQSTASRDPSFSCRSGRDPHRLIPAGPGLQRLSYSATSVPSARPRPSASLPFRP